MIERAADALVIGAGPAGLTAASALARAGLAPVVLEADPQHVGGIARTLVFRGHRLDIGGHRFFTDDPTVQALWREWLPHDLIECRRSSRIQYRGQLFRYPLEPREALRQLGAIEALRCVASYLAARLRPYEDPRTFERWMVNRFGRRLFTIFFETYTEKVWGMRCAEISADWAKQRVGAASLGAALLPAWRGSARARTLASTFWYPRLGPGMLWEACAAEVSRLGGDIRLGRRVVRCEGAHDGTLLVEHRGSDGGVERIRCGSLISTMALPDLVAAMAPALDEAARAAAERLQYRDFMLVALVARDRGSMSDQWRYVHDPGLRVGRVQNFKAWSPDMAPDAATTCYGLEYFCNTGGDLWTRPDAGLIDLATAELDQLGIAKRTDVLDGCVVRQPRAYPVYDRDYASRVAAVRAALETRFPSLHLAGRNGLHRYDNQDHAMLSGLAAAAAVLGVKPTSTKSSQSVAGRLREVPAAAGGG